MRVLDCEHDPRGGCRSEYWLRSDVIFFPSDDGSARLLDLDGGIYALPAIGAEMLKGALADGPEATSRRLATHYAVDPARVRTDLEALFSELRRERLVQPWNGSARLRMRTALAVAVIYPALGVLGFFRSQRCLRTTAHLVLARFCFAWFGWAVTVAAWQRYLGLPRKADPGPEQIEIIMTIDEAVRQSAAKLPSTACKERALTCWFLLSLAGIRAKLVVGIQLFPLAGHCWCEAGSRVLTDFSDRCRSYTPIISYISDHGLGVNLSGRREMLSRVRSGIARWASGTN